LEKDDLQKNIWDINEGTWTPAFKWFLVDEGLIQYSFTTKDEADLFKAQGYMHYMLTTNIDNLANDTMLDASDESNWAGIPICVRRTFDT
jgi:hypothetical protein